MQPASQPQLRHTSPIQDQGQQQRATFKDNTFVPKPTPRPLPPDPPQLQKSPLPPSASVEEAYGSAFSSLQSPRSTGSFYPEGHMLSEAVNTPSTGIAPELVSPRPQRLAPAMPATLESNLEQRYPTKNWNEVSVPGDYLENPAGNNRRPYSHPPQLPPLDLSASDPGDRSPSDYEPPSVVDEYFRNDYPSIGQTGRPVQQPAGPRDYIPTSTPRTTEYNSNVPYNAPGSYQYQPQPSQPGHRPQPRSNSLPRKPVNTLTAPEMSYSKSSSFADQQMSPPPIPSQQTYSSQDSQTDSLPPAPTTTTLPSPSDNFVAFPEPKIPTLSDLSLKDRSSSPPRPTEQSSRRPSLPGSPSLTPQRASSPPTVVAFSEEQWQQDIESHAPTALRTTDPNIALDWVEKVYMYVSISLDDLNRQHALTAIDTEAGKKHYRPATPEYENALRNDARDIVEKFIGMGNAKATYIRGIWLEYGDFKYPCDRHEAYHSYVAAAKKGYSRAEYRLGKMYEDTGDMKRGLYHYNRGVTQGDAACLYRVGMLRLLGQKGSPVNIPEAIKYLFQAAGKADLDAPQGAYVFALLLGGEFAGVTVPESILPRDERAARRMLEKASSLGFSHAQEKLGVAYEHGTWGCGFDPQLSVHYYTLAAKQGDLNAMLGLSKWYLCGAEGLPPNEEKAFTYAERAARSGLPQAEFAMGYFYEVGIFVQVDIEVAEHWYALAAEHGDREAIQRRESVSRKQTLSRKDHETITSNIRSRRLKKGQKAPPADPQVSTTPPLKEPVPEIPRPLPPDPPMMTQSPARPQPKVPSTSPPASRSRQGSSAARRPERLSDGSRQLTYNNPEQSQTYRQEGYSSNTPSLAGRASEPDEHAPPQRPGSRPPSQGRYPTPPVEYGPPRLSDAETFGNGPKTFAEMGLQTSHKKDSDCVIM